KLAWQIHGEESTAGVERAQDTLKASQIVVPAVPERTLQATIFQLSAPQSISVQTPSDARPGRGGSDVTLQAKLACELPGVREYLSSYRYDCFEQRASVAIGTRDKARWAALMRVLPDYLDRDGMVKYWPLLYDGDDSLTSYVLSISREAGWEIPERQRSRMEQ